MSVEIPKGNWCTYIYNHRFIMKGSYAKQESTQVQPLLFEGLD